MKLDLSNELADYIITKAKEHDQIAQNFANMYAQSDDKADQAVFKMHSVISNEIQDLHRIVCGYLHEIETKIET